MNTKKCLLHIPLFFLTYSSSVSALHFWEVTYTGQSQGVSFSRHGNIAVYLGQATSVTSNQPNPIELAFYSGNPGANPESGAIWFMTNNAFLGGSSRVDLADMRFIPTTQGDGSCVVIEPDQSLSSIGINVFNAYSGLTADAYQIFSGYMYFCSSDGWETITGEINILGTGALFHSNTEYYATVSGRYIDEH
jgi:hypothetical protein